MPGTPDLVGPGLATATITEMKAGHYGVLCFFAAPDGKSHFEHGMFTVFDVKGSKSSYKPPQDGVVDVTMTDSSIKVPARRRAQHATIKVTNSGKASHSFTIVKLETGKTIDDAKTYFDAFFNEGGAPGTAPGTVVGGISEVAPGGIVVPRLEPEARALRICQHGRRCAERRLREGDEG